MMDKIPAHLSHEIGKALKSNKALVKMVRKRGLRKAVQENPSSVARVGFVTAPSVKLAVSGGLVVTLGASLSYFRPKIDLISFGSIRFLSFPNATIKLPSREAHKSSLRPFLRHSHCLENL